MRQLLTIVLPIVLPILVYWLYITMARHKAQRVEGGDELPGWDRAPWAWILLAGVVLMIATLVVFRLQSGVQPDVKLEPPRLIDGQVVPAHPVE